MYVERRGKKRNECMYTVYWFNGFFLDGQLFTQLSREGTNIDDDLE